MLIFARFDLLAPDLATLVSLVRDKSDFFIDAWSATITVAASASACALLLSILAAVLTLRFRLADIVFAPLVAVSQSFPLQAIAPLIVIVLGGGFQTKLVVAFVIAFFPIFNACRVAIRTTPPSLIALSATCHATFLAEILYIRLPDALPAIAAAAKVGFTLAVLGAVVAEFINPDSGIGRVLLSAQSSYNVEVIYIAVIILIAQGLVVYGALSAVESHLLKQRSS